MNYKESLEFLDNIPKLNAPLGTEMIFRLLRKMDNPQDTLKVVHVAGTNGKGSVSNFIKNILKEGSYNVGLFNSPNILSYRETITYNNQMISKEDFAKIATDISKHCNALVLEGFSHPTTFECYTALAIGYFHLMNVDFAIIETGLGGKDDATNVFKSPILTLITSIGYDHTEFLGINLKDIAKAKAGIIKYKTPVVVAPNENEVIDLIFDVAFSHNAPFYAIDKDNMVIDIHHEDLNGMSFSIKTPYYHFQNLHMKLIGHHQLINVSLALMAITLLKQDYIIADSSIKLGISKTYWPCRCEFLKSPIPMIIDGAHNEQSIDTFVQVLSSYCSSIPITFFFGILKDKEVDRILQKLKPFSDVIFLTQPLTPRAFPLSELEVLSKKYFTQVIPIMDASKALEAAIEYSKKNGSLLCCVGSLYLAVPVRSWIDI